MIPDGSENFMSLGLRRPFPALVDIDEEFDTAAFAVEFFVATAEAVSKLKFKYAKTHCLIKQHTVLLLLIC